MEHAFPLDELRPLSCGGEDSLGGYALTLVRWDFFILQVFHTFILSVMFTVCCHCAFVAD